MRCIACNKMLSDFEATKKNASTGVYLDLCSTCIKESGIKITIIEREDLRLEVSNEDDQDFENFNDNTTEET